MTLNTFEAATRLINAATGDPYGDGTLVHRIGTGICGDDPDKVWVTGIWHDKYEYGVAPEDGGDAYGRKLTSNVPSRLAEALGRIEVDVQWYDEVDECVSCNQLIRTKPDSSWWRPEFVEVSDGMLCAECIQSKYSPAEFIGYAASDVEGACGFMFDGAAKWLERHGWHLVEEEFASGWYGRHDEPTQIAAQVRERVGEDALLAFVSDYAHTFETRYVVYWLEDADREQDLNEQEN